MDVIYVQFSDSRQETIVSTFSCPQDPEVWPNQGEVQAIDARWRAYFEARPEFIQDSLPDPAIDGGDGTSAK